LAPNIRKLAERIARQDDEKAFRQLFEHFYPGLNDFAFYFVKTKANAEEVVTDVFVKVWQNRKKLTSIVNVKAYLFTITKREALNYIRNNKLNERLFIQIDDQMKFISKNPEHEYLTNELLLIISNSINNLPEKCRLVFRLVKENGLKYKEVASMLDITEKAVEMHISKALKRIKRSLDTYQDKKDPVNIPKIVARLILLILLV